jgi:gluconolactonase
LPGLNIREVASGLEFPEGPVALPGGEVVVVELRGGRVTGISPDGTKRTIATVGGGPNGAALGPDGALYVVNSGGFAWSHVGDLIMPFAADGSTKPDDFNGGWIDRVDMASGGVETILDSFEGLPLCGPNDIVFDRDGGMWFTDFGKTRNRSMDLGAVYYAAADGSQVRCVANNLIGPNGIGLSPGGDRLYVAESYTGRVLQWTISGPGEVEGRSAVYISTPENFDSLAVEADGTVVAAAMRGLCVVRPDRTWEVMEMPDVLTTNVCFAGPDLTTAFVTLSARGRLVRLDWPRPGLELNWN